MRETRAEASGTDWLRFGNRHKCHGTPNAKPGTATVPIEVIVPTGPPVWIHGLHKAFDSPFLPIQKARNPICASASRGLNG